MNEPVKRFFLNKTEGSSSSYNWKQQGIKGATHHVYSQLVIKQGGVCAICGNPPTARNLALDHDQESGAIRGLLCTHCNVALGFLEKFIKEPERLKPFENYLARGPVELDTTLTIHPRPYVAERRKILGAEVQHLLDTSFMWLAEACEEVGKKHNYSKRTVRRAYDFYLDNIRHKPGTGGI